MKIIFEIDDDIANRLSVFIDEPLFSFTSRKALIEWLHRKEYQKQKTDEKHKPFEKYFNAANTNSF